MAAARLCVRRGAPDFGHGLFPILLDLTCCAAGYRGHGHGTNAYCGRGGCGAFNAQGSADRGSGSRPVTVPSVSACADSDVVRRRYAERLFHARTAVDGRRHRLT